MGIATALLLLPLVQEPQTGLPDTFVWPPVAGATQRYTARLHKERKLSAELQAAEREARAALGLRVTARPPRQSVTLEMDLELRPEAGELVVRYTARLPKAPELRLKLLPLARQEGEDLPPPLGNGAIDAVWGLADQREPDLAVSRAALERSFEQRFGRDGRSGVAPADFAANFGDHLLPVLWDQPLPCWIGQMAKVLELGGEAAFDGKTLIRDGSGSFPLGHRETRVELAFTAVSGGSFSIRYRMKVRQVVGRTRDLQRDLPRPFDWIFEIAGEADYSVKDQSFARIRETVTAWPEKPGEEQLARLRDEAFAGTIEIDRAKEPGKPPPPRRTGRQ